MITIQCEKFADVIDDVRESLILEDHWEDLALNKDKVKLEPQWDVYYKKEQEGQLFLCTIRKDSKIVGYYVGFIGRALHYKSMLTCLPDIYYLKPELRKGTLGIRLFLFVKEELKRRGVQYWVVGDKNHKPVGKIFELIGHKKFENYYSMWLGD